LFFPFLTFQFFLYFCVAVQGIKEQLSSDVQLVIQGETAKTTGANRLEDLLEHKTFELVDAQVNFNGAALILFSIYSHSKLQPE
jgi:hypothetical protein